MTNNPINVRVESEDELYEFANTMIKIMVNMRHWEKVWHEEHGSVHKERMKHWQAKADELIAKMNVPKVNGSQLYQIKIENQTT